VGVAIYVFGARPKVVEIAAHGRAASLPFERFADRVDAVADSGRAIQALSLPSGRGSFGEPIARPIRASQTPVAVGAQGAGTNFFDDPDLMTVEATAGYGGQAPTTPAPVAVETVTEPAPPSDIRIPGQAGTPYNPRQRASLDEGPLRAPPAAAMAGGIAAAATYGGGVSGERMPGASPPVPRPVGGGAAAAGQPSLLAPRVGTSTPEIFRPRPDDVAPIAGTAPVANAPQATMAARWMNDPTGRHQYRYWDGGHWTENVYDAGVESRDRVSG